MEIDFKKILVITLTTLGTYFFVSRKERFFEGTFQGTCMCGPASNAWYNVLIICTLATILVYHAPKLFKKKKKGSNTNDEISEKKTINEGKKSKKIGKKILIGFFIVIGIAILYITMLLFFTQGKSGVCGTHVEQYESSAKGCDKIQGCTCLHEAWLGLGSCDSCSCNRVVSNC